MMSEAAEWKKSFRRHFRSSFLSKSSHFHFDISCAVQGIKPVHLVDSLPPDPYKLQQFLQEVLSRSHQQPTQSHDTISRSHQQPTTSRDCVSGSHEQPCKSNDYISGSSEQLTESHDHVSGSCVQPSKSLDHISRSHDKTCDSQLCILALEEDVLFINYAAFISSLKTVPSRHPVFIDITRGLSRPRVMEREDAHKVEKLLHNCLEELKRAFFAVAENREPNGKTIPVIHHRCHGDHVGGCGTTSAEGNLCSLFGQLLGYPVVYWFDTSKGYSLDMETLVQHCVLVRTERVNEVVSIGDQDKIQVCTVTPTFQYVAFECQLCSECCIFSYIFCRRYSGTSDKGPPIKGH